MNWNKYHIVHIVNDLAEENPFACRALFKISEIKFTNKIPTLAVSISSKPVLMINRKFLDRYADTENDIKAVLLHEFLHIILQHTEKFDNNNPLLNIALDAIINSIIHRTYGEVYSDFFCRFYEPTGITSLLRPDEEDEEWSVIHEKIYSGIFAADDLYELLQYLGERGALKGTEQLIFIGNHNFEKARKITPENEQLLDEILSKMVGTGIWNKPGSRGANEQLNNEEMKIERYKENKWRSSVFNILKSCMTDDNRLKNIAGESTLLLPVLSNRDRRALTTFSWSGLVPFCQNTVSAVTANKTVNIYLDVSGSMSQEIDMILSLLYHFRAYLRQPIWVFSNEVKKAVFKAGKLNYETTYGTSISCVFDHIRVNRSAKNLIVTDGYTESIADTMLSGVRLENLCVIISADGDAAVFDEHHIKYYQLKKQ